MRAQTAVTRKVGRRTRLGAVAAVVAVVVRLKASAWVIAKA